MLCYRMDGADPCDKTCAVTVVATPIVACVDRIDGYAVIFQVQDRVLSIYDLHPSQIHTAEQRT